MEEKMKIIIIGCGKVGYALAEELTQEEHDVTIIDSVASRLQEASEDLDALTIVGFGSSISTLTEAGIATADLLIAVTGSDELNLLCCLMAKKHGRHCQTVARVRNPIYNKEIQLMKESLGISMIINPEFATASEMSRILKFPSAIKIDPFAKGKVELLKFRIQPEFHIDSLTIVSLRKRYDFEFLVVGIERGDEVFIPNGDFVIKNGDVVSIVAAPKSAVQFFKAIGLTTNRVKNCMIIGGGKIGIYLARMLLDMKIKVVIIEKSEEQCKHLAELVPEATVVWGDGTNKKILLEENIGNAEAVVSLTNVDEENILLSLFAKDNSDAKLVTKVNRISFSGILARLDLGSVVYPKYLTTDYILQYIRAMQNTIGSNVETLYHILNNKAEALEFVIRETSAVVEVPLKDLHLKSDLLLSCINRHGKIIIPGGNDSLKVGDTVVVVTTRKGLGDVRDILA